MQRAITADATRVEDREINLGRCFNYNIFPSIVLSPLVLMLVAVPSGSQGNEPFIQADIYNTLYEAIVQCDDGLDQSRSEFITEMFDRYRRNSVSTELLRKLIRYNVRLAQRDIADKTEERELYISELLDVPEESSAEGDDPVAASNDRYENIRYMC